MYITMKMLSASRLSPRCVSRYIVFTNNDLEILFARPIISQQELFTPMNDQYSLSRVCLGILPGSVR